MGTAKASRRARIGWIELIYALFVFAFFTRTALMRGPWLDEFWTFWLTDPTQSAPTLMQRWLSDQHPAFFSIFVHMTRTVVGGSIEDQRVLVNGAGLAAFLAATLVFTRLTPGKSGFFRVFPIIVLALPTTIEAFAGLRSYFLQIVACAVWLEFVFYAAVQARDTPLARSAVAIGSVAAFVMIATHFVAGLQGVILYLGTAALLYPQRRRALVWTTGAAGVAGAAILISGAVQMPRWAHELDFHWITSTAPDTLDMYRNLCTEVLWISLPIVAVALSGRLDTSAVERRFQIATAAAVVVAGCLVLAVNAVQPISVPRYFTPLLVALVAVFAAGASALWSTRFAFRAALLVWALGCLCVSSLRAADVHGWYGGAAEIARIIAKCPTTKVIAISGWTFDSHATSLAASREEPVFALGYRIAGARYGFVPEVVALPSRRGQRLVAVGACPTILWSEHLLSDAPDGEEFAAAGLLVPSGTEFETDTNTEDDVIVLARAAPSP